MRFALPTVEQVQAQSRKVDINFARILANVLLAIPFVFGWLASKFVRAIQLTVAAMQLGWREGFRKVE